MTMPKVSEFKNSKPAKAGAKRRPGRDAAEHEATESEQNIKEKSNENSEKISNEGQVAMNMSEEHSEIKVVDVDKKPETAAQAEATKVEVHVDVKAEASESANADSAEKIEVTKISIKFPGSDLIRARLPRPFDVAEAIATDWVNDGKFDKVPMSHPLAKVAVQQSLRKAKDVEKKVLASPVTEKVAMQAFTYAMKAQTLINEIKSKVKKNKK
jgi:uncharacterized membrane protein YfhO